MRSVKSAACSVKRQRRFATISPNANSAMKAAVFVATLVLFAGLAKGTAFAASGYRNTVTMDVAGAPDIAVAGLNGDVHLSAANTNRVHIVAQLHAESQKNLGQMVVKTMMHGQTLQIQTLCPQSGYWIFHITRCSVNYNITYPRGARIAIHNDNGDVSVEGATADVEIDKSHGDVQAT